MNQYRTDRTAHARSKQEKLDRYHLTIALTAQLIAGGPIGWLEWTVHHDPWPVVIAEFCILLFSAISAFFLAPHVHYYVAWLQAPKEMYLDALGRLAMAETNASEANMRAEQAWKDSEHHRNCYMHSYNEVGLKDKEIGRLEGELDSIRSERKEIDRQMGVLDKVQHQWEIERTKTDGSLWQFSRWLTEAPPQYVEAVLRNWGETFDPVKARNAFRDMHIR